MTVKIEEFLASNIEAKQSMFIINEFDQAALKAVRIAAESELEDLLKMQE